MLGATLGFSRPTRARTRQNPHPYTRVWVLIATGQGFAVLITGDASMWQRLVVAILVVGNGVYVVMVGVGGVCTGTSLCKKTLIQ